MSAFHTILSMDQAQYRDTYQKIRFVFHRISAQTTSNLFLELNKVVLTLLVAQESLGSVLVMEKMMKVKTMICLWIK